MPLYRYVCPECKSERPLMRKVADADSAVWCSCNQPPYDPDSEVFDALKPIRMERQIGEPTARAVETGDEYHGLKSVQGVKEMATERARNHFREHELPRIIEKEGKEFAVRQGFIDEEGNVKI